MGRIVSQNRISVPYYDRIRPNLTLETGLDRSAHSVSILCILVLSNMSTYDQPSFVPNRHKFLARPPQLALNCKLGNIEKD